MRNTTINLKELSRENRMVIKQWEHCLYIVWGILYKDMKNIKRKHNILPIQISMYFIKQNTSLIGFDIAYLHSRVSNGAVYYSVETVESRMNDSKLMEQYYRWNELISLYNNYNSSTYLRYLKKRIKNLLLTNLLWNI